MSAENFSEYSRLVIALDDDLDAVMEQVFRELLSFMVEGNVIKHPAVSAAPGEEAGGP